MAAMMFTLSGIYVQPLINFHVNDKATCSITIGWKHVTERCSVQEGSFFFILPSGVDIDIQYIQFKASFHSDLNSLSFCICSDLDSNSGRTVASSGSQSVSRRKHSSSSSSSQTPGSTRIVYRESNRSSESEFPFWQQNWFIALLFLMALGFFGLALFLFLSLDSDISHSPTASASASAASSEGVEVQITYGAVLKLMHEKTKVRLHSHDVPYGSGSGQQSVTGFPQVDDSNSYWIVRPDPGTSAKQGDAIKSGTIIRLQHMRTRKWLHSHLHASPITGNLEVSCFGGESESDTGDYWKLLIEGSGKTWKQDQRVRLQHVDTGGYLHSHDKKYTRIAGGQQEVCGVREKRADNVWLAAEGVYLPVTESK